MPSPWLALDVGTDPAERSTVLRRAHESFVTSGRSSEPLRDVVVDSWRRSAGADVDPDASLPPVSLLDDELADYRDEHPLAKTLPVVRDLLGGYADDGRHLLAISDAAGRLLWVEGHQGVRRRAERMHFVEGAVWDEAHAGTNAPGTALAVDHAVQIFAAEHYSRIVQPWTCSAAPVHAPDTGELLGMVDLTGGDQLANPLSLALVQATAHAMEAELSRLWVPRQVTAGRLQLLGRDEGLLERDGRPLRLSRRHSEILAILLQHPAGMTGEQLGLELYGDELNPITLRAEMSRLRRLLGPLLSSRPYRLSAEVDADCTAVLRSLEQGDVPSALRRYAGPLLPLSEAPGVRRRRAVIEQQLRAAVLDSDDPSLLATWTHATWGEEDLEMWQALRDTAPAGSPQRAVAAAQARELDSELAWVDPDSTGRARSAAATLPQRTRN